MIFGITTEDGTPVIDVEVAGQRWQAIIDTGFNGELELPELLKSRVNEQFVGRAMSLLAANQRVEEDVFLVDFPFDDRIVRVQATFVDSDEILIGTSMLRETTSSGLISPREPLRSSGDIRPDRKIGLGQPSLPG